MKRFPLTLPPIDELRLEEHSSEAHVVTGLRLNPPIPVRSLSWRWFAFTADGEVFCAAVVPKDFTLSLPGARAEGSAGDYVCLTLTEAFVARREEIRSGAVQLLPLIAQRKP